MILFSELLDVFEFFNYVFMELCFCFLMKYKICIRELFKLVKV